MELLSLSLLGGLTALDGTSMGQVMVSRPLVVGFLAGVLLGDPATGIAVGAMLELYLVVSFPSGGSRFPEGATATVVAVASTVAVSAPGSLVWGVAAGLLWGQMGGKTITALRHLNGHLIPEPGEVATPSRTLPRRHLGAMASDLIRGIVVSAVGVMLGRLLVAWAAPFWPLSLEDATGILLAGALASAGILVRDLRGGAMRPVLLILGVGIGLALGFVRVGMP